MATINAKIATKLQVEHGSLYKITNLHYRAVGPGWLVTYQCEPLPDTKLSSFVIRVSYFTYAGDLKWTMIAD